MSKPRRRRGSNVVDNSLKRSRKPRDEAFRSGWDEVARSIEPLSNIMVGAEDITITLDLPLVDHKQISVRVHGEDIVEVYAKTRRTVRFDDLGIRHRRGEFTCYHILMDLPERVDGAKAIHNMKHGVLEIRLPKLR